MKLNIQAVNFNAKPELLDYVQKKMDKLDQFYDKILGAQVYLKVENTTEKENKMAEIKLEIPGDDLIVKKVGQSFEECLDLATDTLKRLIKRKKEKLADF